MQIENILRQIMFHFTWQFQSIGVSQADSSGLWFPQELSLSHCNNAFRFGMLLL